LQALPRQFFSGHHHNPSALAHLATNLFVVRLPSFVSLHAGTPFARAFNCKELLEAISLQALVAAAVLVQMLPMLGALGLAGSAAFIGAIFGPSQVASLLINMLGGKNLAPVSLAVIAASLMDLSHIVLLFGTPSIIATMMFASFLALETASSVLSLGPCRCRCSAVMATVPCKAKSCQQD